ncbi:hypothetical protein [Laspinema olomoucense]|uniref:hypothetical protein n=1 Tax=Laspinema olomoucense TaxID=3231600 RepID=UPI0021BA4098|nr:hypothetical protein [Laspinema sp. D3a]MCT7990712.1 hypothetical protein [Laspinema sp. D3a]
MINWKNILAVGGVLVVLQLLNYHYGQGNFRTERVQTLVPVGTSPVYPTAPVQIPAGWNHLFSPDGRFSVIVPKVPLKEIRNGKSLDHEFLIQIESEMYSIGYRDYPLDLSKEEQREILDEMGKISNPNWEAVNKRNFGLNGHPGVEIEMKPKAFNYPPGKTWLIYVGRRLYSMVVVTPYPQNAEMFLRSFQPL